MNLERPVRLEDRLGGHLVQGHVDGLGDVVAVVTDGSQRTVTVRVDPALARYVAEKGSVAMNGVSLTVTAVTPDTFSVALIPFTVEETNLGELGAARQALPQQLGGVHLAQEVEVLLARIQLGISNHFVDRHAVVLGTAQAHVFREEAGIKQRQLLAAQGLL